MPNNCSAVRHRPPHKNYPALFRIAHLLLNITLDSLMLKSWYLSALLFDWVGIIVMGASRRDTKACYEIMGVILFIMFKILSRCWCSFHLIRRRMEWNNFTKLNLLLELLRLQVHVELKRPAYYILAIRFVKLRQAF